MNVNCRQTVDIQESRGPFAKVGDQYKKQGLEWSHLNPGEHTRGTLVYSRVRKCNQKMEETT